MLNIKVGDRVYYEYTDIAKIGPKELEVIADFKGDAVIESMSGLEGLRIVTLLMSDGRRKDVPERTIKRVYSPEVPEAESAPKYEAHQHSVIESAATLAAAASGSLKGCESAVLEFLAKWLRWRIEDGWESSSSERTKMFDESVRNMASAALRMYECSQTGNADDFSIFITCTAPAVTPACWSSPMRRAEHIARLLVLNGDASSPVRVVVTNKRFGMTWEYDVSVVAQTGAASARLVSGSVSK